MPTPIFVSIPIALQNIRPGATWRVSDNDYDTLEWTDEVQSKPTREEVETELARLNNLKNNTEYQRLRAAEYPSFADQFDLLYHGGYDTWKQTIQAVKDKYPKP